MRISIWQQFSSNHSSDFTVVGRFGSSEEAQAAFEQLTQWMTKILYEHSSSRTTQAEISQRYNLEWYDEGLDWNGRPDDITEVVKRVQNDVFLVCPIETYDSAVPFVGLMWKIGARRVQYQQEYQRLCVYLTCEAPDEKIAEANFGEINEYLDVIKKLPPTIPPWYYGKGLDLKGYLNGGAIRRKGQTLYMHLQFFHTEFGLDTFINYLVAKGLTKIEYKFYEDSEWGRDKNWDWFE